MPQHSERPYDVLVVGDLNPDVVLTGLQSPEPRLGTEQFFRSMERTLGGSGSLAAATMARTGLRTLLTARVGDDEPAAFCKAFLEREGVTTNLLVNPALATGMTIALAYPNDRLLLTSPGAIADITAEDLPDVLLAKARHIHVSAYFLQSRLRPGLAGLFRRANRLGLTTSLDTGWDPAEGWLDTDLTAALAQTDVFLPNSTELEHITRESDPARAAAIILGLGAGSVVLKDGARGSHYFGAGLHDHHSGFPITPVDTTGAGDAFDAGYLCAMLEGRSISDCLRFGNACGAAVAGVSGGAGGNLTRADFDRIVEKSP
ncbi:MAG: carbohydrate kinase family protein [Devosia sp.]